MILISSNTLLELGKTRGGGSKRTIKMMQSKEILACQISSAYHDRVVKLGTRFGIFLFWFSLQCCYVFSFPVFLVDKNKIIIHILKKKLISEL